MPKEYEAIRDSVKQRLIAKGVSPAKALKEGKRIGAATYNKRHPDNPVTGKSPSDYGLSDAEGSVAGQKNQSEAVRRGD